MQVSTCNGHIETALHLMHSVSFNAAFNASKGALTSLVLLGEGKGSPFFSLVHVVSGNGPEKESIKHFLSY